MTWRFTSGRAQERPGAEPAVLRCSFCRKGQDEVQRLIAGPDVFICDECLNVCNDIVAADRVPIAPEGSASVFTPTDEADSESILPCSLCGMQTIAGERLVVLSRGILCAGCIGEFEAALEQHRIARGRENVGDGEITNRPNEV